VPTTIKKDTENFVTLQITDEVFLKNSTGEGHLLIDVFFILINF